MTEIKVPFHRAAITKDEENAVLEVLRSGWLTTGKYALEFEKKFSAAVSDKESMKEARRALALSDGDIISLAVNFTWNAFSIATTK